MSTRNYDSSQLTWLKRDRNQAAFFTLINNAQAAAQGGVIVNSYNPQTGNYNASKMNDIDNGSRTTYYRSTPATIISVPCFCVDASGIPAATQNENVPIQQPVNDASPQQ
jgi:gentisate 1,2-dioxygenase